MAALSYFDLGRNQRGAVETTGGLETTGAAEAPAGAGAAPAGPSATQQALQYLALVIGIVLEPWVTAYAADGGSTISLGDMLGRVPFGIVIGMALFPMVYRNAFDPTKPFFVQFCTVLVTGLGWQSALSSVLPAS